MKKIKQLLCSLKRRIFPIIVKGTNNEVTIRSPKLGKVRISIQGKNNKIIVEKDVLLYNLRITISGDNNTVVFSPKSRIYNLSLNLSGDSNRFHLGENAGIRQADVLIWESQSVIIGNDSMISYGVTIRTSDSHAILDNTTGERINAAKSIRVGEHSWIAQNATLLKGADIGNHSVVGFGSICSRRYPDNCIIAGCPGRVIRENIDWSRSLV